MMNLEITEGLIRDMQKILPLNEGDTRLFLSKFEWMKLKKGDYFIREGQVSRKLGFIIKGCMMCLYNKDGEEVVEEFSLDREFITDYTSFLTHCPADKSIKCVEDTELIVIDYEYIKKLYMENPTYEKVGRVMAESLFRNRQEKSKTLVLDDAEERYLKLVRERPELPLRVPQYLIASYLNIRPETLSRIRKKWSSDR